MTIFSAPEPPILANSERARNCLGLNATVLPGLGTFRHGSRSRGFLEMTAALGGTFWFCKALFLVVGEVSEGMPILAALKAHSWKLFFSVALVLGSWISGVRYGRAILKG